MRNVSQIESAIAALQSELDTARKNESAEAREAAKGFVIDYDYSVKWPHSAQFRVERKATAESLERIANFVAMYGPTHAPKPFEGGMTYSCLVGDYITSGGGSVIIEFGETSSFDPSPFKPEWLESLRAGIVPDAIKRP